MKKIILFLIAILSFQSNAQVITCQQHKSALNTQSLYYSAENLRSDTMDVLKYTITLDITDFVGKAIKGNTKIKFTPKMNNQNRLRLDLLKLIIDSVKKNTTVLTYGYNDTVLKVNLPTAMNVLDTAEIIVYYHGAPQGDASWGGFYFTGAYAFNLGVGFSAAPHAFGRVWFPCFDNFVEKSVYDFIITSDTSKRAYCNGTLISDTKSGSKRTRTWTLNKEIPSYLASVAVAPYTQVTWTTTAMSGTLPIILAAVPADTSQLKIGFVNLKTAISGFENYYGPYVWNRIGYAVVPFNSGAMEHATNIAYPQACIGNLSYEASIMAHELSHHWWGDNMTCETQEDMWLNEGMATYSQYLFKEWMYNKQQYIADVKNTHDYLCAGAHVSEKKYWAVSGVPHQYTYGDHVYKKGADVAHTLRTYMGDAAFFAGLKYVQVQKSFKNMNSIEFRNLLQTSSGQNLTDFFNNWVLAGGWPHFSIDSMKYVSAGGGSVTAMAYVKQKLTGCTVNYSNVPLEITFFDNAWNKTVRNIVMSGANQSFTMSLPFAPIYSAINFDSKISDAISHEYKVVKSTGNFNYSLGRALILVSNKGADSSFIRVEHNFTYPDAIKNNTVKNYKLSTQRYWRIDGVLSPGFISKLRLNYDVNVTFNMDTCLANPYADSLILVYRKNAADDWAQVKNLSQFKSGQTSGWFTIDTLKLGEYAFANKQGPSTIGIKQITEKQNSKLKVYPNPATNQLNIGVENYNSGTKEIVEIRNVEGKVIYTQGLKSNNMSVDCSSFSKGVYFVNLLNEGKVISNQKVVLE